MTGTLTVSPLNLEDYGSPEAALLLASSRGDASRATIRRLMSRNLDWEHLTRLAVESHATPGLWEVVSAFPDLPREARALQSLAALNDFRRYHIRSLLARTVEELRQVGIEVMALKGAALLAGGVARPTPRTMSDIDLLVIKGSPEDAWRACRSKGWTMVDPGWTEEKYRGHHHLPPLVDPEGVSIGLEIHRTMMAGIERLGVDTAAIIARSRLVSVGSVSVRVPSQEDLLLHACLHFAWSNKMGRGAWRAFADCHAIIADPGFDWNRFLAVADSRQARMGSYWTLRVGAEVADLPVPAEVLKGLDPTAGGRFATLLERHFACRIVSGPGAAEVAERVQRWLWLAAMQERSTSEEADAVWMEGAVEVPGVQSVSPRAPRGAFRAAISTTAYLARLVLRG